jgi:hypothetical protein
VLAVIAAAAGRDCVHRIATRKNWNHNRQSGGASFAIRSTRDSHSDAAPRNDAFAFSLPFRREQAALLA